MSAGNRKKRLMLLGGSRYLLPVIRAAHELGMYVITADYLPDNIAHKYSDEYCNVSVIDREAVLNEAREHRIDGILSFACDPGVVTAAYVAEKTGLPFQGSFEAVSILQDKGRFRDFLTKNGFNCPRFKRYTDAEDALHDVEIFTFPVIVKPVDSAGSKGVTRVNEPERLETAIRSALNKSRSGAFIIEEFLTFNGYHSSTDPFSVNGELKFCTFSDQLFDPDAENPYTPAYIIWPSTMEEKHQQFLASEIQRLMTLLRMGTGIYNIETCVGSDGAPYIMEVSPRGGGCKIAELQRMAYGADLIGNEVRKAVGMPLLPIASGECDGVWCEMVIHAGSGRSGRFKEIRIDPGVRRKHIRMMEIRVKEGDPVEPFTGADMALGDLFLRFDTRKELDEALSRADEWMEIRTEP